MMIHWSLLQWNAVENHTGIVSEASISGHSEPSFHNDLDVVDLSVREEPQLLQATAPASTPSEVKCLTDELASGLVHKRIKDLKQPWVQGPMSCDVFEKRINRMLFTLFCFQTMSIRRELIHWLQQQLNLHLWLYTVFVRPVWYVRKMISVALH